MENEGKQLEIVLLMLRPIYGRRTHCGGVNLDMNKPTLGHSIEAFQDTVTQNIYPGSQSCGHISEKFRDKPSQQSELDRPWLKLENTFDLTAFSTTFVRLSCVQSRT